MSIISTTTFPHPATPTPLASSQVPDTAQPVPVITPAPIPAAGSQPLAASGSGQTINTIA
jgi:hypothetical protein